MKRAIILSCVMAAAIGATAFSAQARGFGPGGQGGPGGPGGPGMVFADLDADGDGILTAAELEAFGKARFDAADADKDGFLSLEEMQAQSARQAQERMAKRSERMLEHMDDDGDGQLSFDEMRPDEARRAKMFSRLDGDGNGEISQAEFDAARMQMREHRHERKGNGTPDR